MNKKKKVRLVILVVCLLTVIAVLICLEQYEKQQAEKVVETTKSYEVTSFEGSDVQEIGMIQAEESFNLTRTTDGWKCTENSDIKIDAELVEEFISNVSTLTSDTKIENVTNLAQYGLEEPVINVTFQWSNNMYTVTVGDYNSIISAYYICVNEGTEVYTISSTQYYQLNKGLNDFEIVEVENVSEESEETASIPIESSEAVTTE